MKAWIRPELKEVVLEPQVAGDPPSGKCKGQTVLPTSQLNCGDNRCYN